MDHSRADEWIQKLGMQEHPEGGWFREVYHAPADYGTAENGQPLAGSIYFLLDQGDISHFHVIDCDEIWYHHEGCGVELFLLEADGTVKRQVMGCGNGMEPMVIIPKGVIFGARNVDPNSYTLMSCATIPAFHYEGFRLIPRRELEGKYPGHGELLQQMAFEDIPKF